VNFRGKVALVTGAGRGIGKATALALAEAGAAVGVNDREFAPARRVVDKIVARGGQGIVLEADITRGDQVRAMVGRLLEAFDRMDILVNNAGINQMISVFETTEADWDRLMAVNLTGAFHCVQAVIGRMRDQGGGRIVNVSSDCGKRGGKISGVHFSASKAALQAFTKALARQLAPYQITVNDVAPASILTERLQQTRTPEQLEAMARQIPLGRLGRATDVACAIRFLASDEAAHITGASLDVGGGALIY
jgi:3-oxoacyl-[acyl-carrier protein] reductase